MLCYLMPGLPITYNDPFHGVGSHPLGTSILVQGGLARIRKSPAKFRPGAQGQVCPSIHSVVQKRRKDGRQRPELVAVLLRRNVRETLPKDHRGDQDRKWWGERESEDWW